MLKLLYALIAKESIADKWDIYFGAHMYWKTQVYTTFKVNNIHELLNVEPAIDHVDYYNATIPNYFHSLETLNWIDANFDDLPSMIKNDALLVVRESASIYAAHAMCHPRDKVGKFNWDDVINLHKCLNTKYIPFFEKHRFYFNEETYL